MSVRARLRATARVALAAGAALVAVSLLAVPAHAADDDGASGGIGLTVPVIGSAVTPATGTAAGSSGRGSGTGGGVDAVVTAPAEEPAPAEGDLLIAGGLYLSDITGTSRPTPNPLEGKADLWFTLRNLSTDTIDATADFSIATLTGALIDDARVEIAGLKPGESRVVGATLSGTGQWPFVAGRVTLNPPDEIEGQPTAAVSRAAVVYVFPWLGARGARRHPA